MHWVFEAERRGGDKTHKPPLISKYSSCFEKLLSPARSAQRKPTMEGKLSCQKQSKKMDI